jgi:hypothetical protein
MTNCELFVEQFEVAAGEQLHSQFENIRRRSVTDLEERNASFCSRLVNCKCNK